MPRLSPNDHLERHQRLREIYLAWPMTFIRLDPDDHFALSLLYEPEREHTVESLRANQQEVKLIDASLPQRAGKAYVKVLRLLPLVQERASRPRKKGAPYELFVFSELNEDLDPTAMVKLLLRMAREAQSEADEAA